jgi:hypothetical protein
MTRDDPVRLVPTHHDPLRPLCGGVSSGVTLDQTLSLRRLICSPRQTAVRVQLVVIGIETPNE